MTPTHIYLVLWAIVVVIVGVFWWRSVRDTTSAVPDAPGTTAMLILTVILALASGVLLFVQEWMH